jgi:hypothetical protein
MHRFLWGGGQRALTWLLGALLLFIAAGVLFPVFTGGHDHSRINCLSRVKQVAIGMAIYATDYNDRFPLAAKWMDDMYPYVKQETIFHCSVVDPKTEYGFAMNSFLAGADTNKLDEPAEMHLMYESRGLQKNLSEYLPSFPIPPRHGLVNFVAFADTHAKGVRMKFDEK